MKKIIILLLFTTVLFGQFKFQMSRPDRYYKIYMPGCGAMWDKDIAPNGWGIYTITNVKEATHTYFGTRGLRMVGSPYSNYSTICIDKINLTVPYGQEFTFECYFYPYIGGNANNSTPRMLFITTYGTGYGAIWLSWNHYNTNDIFFGDANSTSSWGISDTLSQVAPYATRFYHLAYTRKGDSVYIFIDGKLKKKKYSIDNFVNYTTTYRMYIGCQGNGNQNVFDGIIQSIRFSEKARYTSDFLPPRRPY